jgi:hypothetical protein
MIDWSELEFFLTLGLVLTYAPITYLMIEGGVIHGLWEAAKLNREKRKARNEERKAAAKLRRIQARN